MKNRKRQQCQQQHTLHQQKQHQQQQSQSFFDNLNMNNYFNGPKKSNKIYNLSNEHHSHHEYHHQSKMNSFAATEQQSFVSENDLDSNSKYISNILQQKNNQNHW